MAQLVELEQNQGESYILFLQRFYHLFVVLPDAPKESESVSILLSKMGRILLDELLKQFTVDELSFLNMKEFLKEQSKK